MIEEIPPQFKAQGNTNLPSKFRLLDLLSLATSPEIDQAQRKSVQDELALLGAASFSQHV